MTVNEHPTRGLWAPDEPLETEELDSARAHGAPVAGPLDDGPTVTYAGTGQPMWGSHGEEIDFGKPQRDTTVVDFGKPQRDDTAVDFGGAGSAGGFGGGASGGGFGGSGFGGGLHDTAVDGSGSAHRAMTERTVLDAYPVNTRPIPAAGATRELRDPGTHGMFGPTPTAHLAAGPGQTPGATPAPSWPLTRTPSGPTTPAHQDPGSTSAYPGAGTAAGYPDAGSTSAYPGAGSQAGYQDPGSTSAYPGAGSPAGYQGAGSAAGYPVAGVSGGGYPGGPGGSNPDGTVAGYPGAGYPGAGHGGAGAPPEWRPPVANGAGQPAPGRHRAKIAVVGAVVAAAVASAGITAGIMASGDDSASTAAATAPGAQDSTGQGQQQQQQQQQQQGGTSSGSGSALTGSTALHGEYVVSDGNGSYLTVIAQVGTVSAVSADSITVKSDDGFSKTYEIADATTVNGGQSEVSAVENDHTVQVVATTENDKATATAIVDADLAASTQQQGGFPGGGQQGGPGQSGQQGGQSGQLPGDQQQQQQQGGTTTQGNTGTGT